MRAIFLMLLLSVTCMLRAQLIGDRQNGLASYYSTEYDGAETAYGVIYDKDELVAAHKAFPLNSTVRVTNESNGESVVVRIIDKGPFIRGRIIELSERAAAEIGMLGERTVPVELQLLSTPDQQALQPTPAASSSNPTTTPPAPIVREAEAESSPASAPSAPTISPAPITTSPATKPDPPSVPLNKRTFTEGLYQINVQPPKEGRYGVQVGSFNNLESAMDKVVELKARYFDEILLHKGRTNGQAVYKVILGTFSDHDSARHYAASLKQRYGIPGFTIDLPR